MLLPPLSFRNFQRMRRPPQQTRWCSLRHAPSWCLLGCADTQTVWLPMKNTDRHSSRQQHLKRPSAPSLEMRPPQIPTCVHDLRWVTGESSSNSPTSSSAVWSTLRAPDAS